MNSLSHTFKKIDKPLLFSYLILCIIGWVSIFSAVYDPEHARIIDTSQRYGMQMIWILSGWALAFVLLCINAKAYPVLSGVAYGLGIALLLAVLVLGSERGGSKSWLVLGPVSIQPGEFMKIPVALALASVMSKHGFRLSGWTSYFKVAALIFIPIGLILLEKETGLALVFLGFSLVLFREGMPGWILLAGIVAIALFLLSIVIPLQTVFFIVLMAALAAGFLYHNKLVLTLLLAAYFSAGIWGVPTWVERLTGFDLRILFPGALWAGLLLLPVLVAAIWQAFRRRLLWLKVILLFTVGSLLFVLSVDYVFANILQPHQRVRIENLVGKNTDIYGAGYNVHQSMVAIGSGGLTGKGFLQGTQTKFNFVPEQSTDFIFCTIGEEWGFLGSAGVIMLYLFFICRLLLVAERQRDPFIRIYGYGVAACFFMHFFINIGMTIGLCPVIGIPLPLISYGGSSLWSFTILLFILLKMDTTRR